MVLMRALQWLASVGALGLLMAACSGGEEPIVGPQFETPPPPAAGPELETAPEEPTAEPDAAGLRVGYLLPESGPLAFLGPDQIGAVEMAVQEVNAAGGVLGDEVIVLGGDEAGDATVASASVDRLLAEGVDAIVGAAASGISLAVIDRIVGAGVMQCSPSNTSAIFTDYDDNGLYFRTIPSDALQGPALAQTIVGDGHATLAILARDDDYGRALVAAVEQELEEAGVAVVESVAYDPQDSTFSAAVAQVADAAPSAVAIISFDESAGLLQELLDAGLDPTTVGMYGTDGVRDPALPEVVDADHPSSLDGMKGTTPVHHVTSDFLEKIEAFDEDLEPVFAAPAYDCTNLIALAAESAGATDGPAMAAEVQDLFAGDNECMSFGECVEFLEAGETVAYRSATGITAFMDSGEPGGGTIDIWGFLDGELVTLDSLEVSHPEDGR